MAEEQPRYLKVSQAARILGVSTALIYQMIANRRLRSIRVETTVRVENASLEEYIKANATGEVSPADSPLQAVAEVVSTPRPAPSTNGKPRPKTKPKKAGAGK